MHGWMCARVFTNGSMDGWTDEQIEGKRVMGGKPSG